MAVPLGNKESDKLAKEGAEKEIPEPIDIQILTDFDVQGVKLATINQATAYKGILKKWCRPLRQGMERNLEMTIATVAEITNSWSTTILIQDCPQGIHDRWQMGRNPQLL